jgi:hypothetical protein
MLTAFEQMASKTMLFTGMFQAPVTNFYNTEEVEIDIMRSGEDVGIVVQDISAGYRSNSANIYTNKAFKAPVYKESAVLNSFDLMKRDFGQNPFGRQDFRSKITSKALRLATNLSNKIDRAIELQGSQVMTTGTATLTNESGVASFTISYSPKSSHFPNAGTAWSASGATPISDLSALADIIRGDGMEDPDQLFMGAGDFEAFIQNTDVQKRFDLRRVDLGALTSFDRMGNGGNYRGVVTIGNYKFDVFTYNGRYKHPQTGVSTAYLPTGKVIMKSSTARLDATFGAIPNIGKELGISAPSPLPEFTGRLASSSMVRDMFTNAWLSPDGEQLNIGVGSRPLLIPTAIDTYGCLSTGVS